MRCAISMRPSFLDSRGQLSGLPRAERNRRPLRSLASRLWLLCAAGAFRRVRTLGHLAQQAVHRRALLPQPA